MKILLTILISFIGFTGILLVPSGGDSVYAASSNTFEGSTNEACAGLAIDGSSFINCDNPDNDNSVNSTISLALNMLSLVAGIIAVILIIISGLKFMTSQGDSQQVSQARNSVIYAVIGIATVALAQIIVKFVLTKTSKAVIPAP